MTQYSHLSLFGYVGHPWPIFFPWSLLAHFLALYSHGFLLTPLGFPIPITLSFIFGVHGLSINPLLFFFHYFGHAVAHSHFSTSHIAHRFASSLFSSSFRPVYFLKAYLLILWACNPLFLQFGLNGFSIHLLTLFCPCCWASSFYWASKNDHQHLAF